MTHQQHATRRTEFARFADAIEARVGKGSFFWALADKARRTTMAADEANFFTALLNENAARAARIENGTASPEEIAYVAAKNSTLEAVKQVYREINADLRRQHEQLRAQLVAAGGDPDQPHLGNDNDQR